MELENITNTSFFSYRVKESKLEVVHYPTTIDESSTCIFDRGDLIVVKDPSYNALINTFISLGLELNPIVDYFE